MSHFPYGTWYLLTYADAHRGDVPSDYLGDTTRNAKYGEPTANSIWIILGLMIRKYAYMTCRRELHCISCQFTTYHFGEEPSSHLILFFFPEKAAEQMPQMLAVNIWEGIKHGGVGNFFPSQNSQAWSPKCLSFSQLKHANAFYLCTYKTGQNNQLKDMFLQGIILLNICIDIFKSSLHGKTGKVSIFI